jgi:hypothetical protein
MTYTNTAGAGTAYWRNDASSEAWFTNLPAPKTTNTIPAAQRIAVTDPQVNEWRDRPRPLVMIWCMAMSLL